MVVSEALVTQLMGDIQGLPATDRAAQAAGLEQLQAVVGRLQAGGMLEPAGSDPLFDGSQKN